MLYTTTKSTSALIGQSAMGYCASKPMENKNHSSSELLYESNRSQALWLQSQVSVANHSPAARDLRILRVSPKIPHGLSTFII